jgi:uncharacterized RDD family membrane protein YckC
MNVSVEVRKDPRAVLVKRWLATVIDVLVLGGSSFALVAALPSQVHERLSWFGGLVVGLVVLLYYTLAEGLLGLTLGKLILKLRVVDGHGNKPGIGRALVRTLLRVIEVNPVLAGGLPAGLMAFFSPTGQRLGDYASSTFVVPIALLQAQASTLQPPT